MAFQHVAPELAQTNPLIALAAVKQSAKIFKSLPDSVKSDREARRDLLSGTEQTVWASGKSKEGGARSCEQRWLPAEPNQRAPAD